MLRITTIENETGRSLILAGQIVGPWTGEFRETWQRACDQMDGPNQVVDLTEVTFIDDTGVDLLREMKDAGVRFVARGADTKHLLREIDREFGQGRRCLLWLPKKIMRMRKGTQMNRTSKSAFTVVLLFSGVVNGAELKPETARAWGDYLAQANTRMMGRTHCHFLWADESYERLRRVRAGEIVVEPIQPKMPITVPYGLVHDWTGASFVPGVHIADVIARLRDYERYGEFYTPAVREVHLVKPMSNADTARDQLVMTLVNQSSFSKRALEVETTSSFVALDTRRSYSISRSVRVQEWAEYGTSSQHKLPIGEGSGYIWSISTISRFEERDGGVYVEFEAIALSRDVPSTLRFLVDPIIRRMSKSALATSLDQTRRAVEMGLQMASIKYKVGG
jgi:hypothetical protein